MLRQRRSHHGAHGQGRHDQPGRHRTTSTPFQELVRLLEQYHISALPVIDDTGRLVGIVSEDDLLIRRAPPTAPPTPARLTRPMP
jgi:CBS domain-containing protein